MNYLLWSVVLWDQPVELRGCRKLHPLELPEQTHGHGLSRVGLVNGRRAGDEAEDDRCLSSYNRVDTIDMEVKVKEIIGKLCTTQTAYNRIYNSDTLTFS